MNGAEQTSAAVHASLSWPAHSLQTRIANSKWEKKEALQITKTVIQYYAKLQLTIIINVTDHGKMQIYLIMYLLGTVCSLNSAKTPKK